MYVQAGQRVHLKRAGHALSRPERALHVHSAGWAGWRTALQCLAARPHQAGFEHYSLTPADRVLRRRRGSLAQRLKTAGSSGLGTLPSRFSGASRAGAEGRANGKFERFADETSPPAT